MSINTRTSRTDTAVRAGIAARLAEIQERADNATCGPWAIWHSGTDYPQSVVANDDGLSLVAETFTSPKYPAADAEFIAYARADVPTLTLAVESVLDYVGRCEESGITMQPGDVRSLIAAALGVTS